LAKVVDKDLFWIKIQGFMIHEEICTYEVAKLAKEKGFPQEPKENNHSDMYSCDGSGTMPVLCSWCVWLMEACNRNNLYAAPTQSLLQRWLREEKGVTICVDIFDDGWFFDISTFYKQDTGVYEVDIPYKSSNVTPVYPTYELALEDALKYALEKLV
jgi:hypothetical protein